MKLNIGIPALNEEDSIRQVIEASLSARDYVIRETDIDAVDITVVSDGSTDRTAEYAGAYADQINLIVFAQNRGYGAAIKESWRHSDAELLGFLDADGTCNPMFFADLCHAVLQEDADVALGCRLNPASRMQVSRRVGNTLFAWLLSLLSLKRVRDTASGVVCASSAVARRNPMVHTC